MVEAHERAPWRFLIVCCPVVIATAAALFLLPASAYGRPAGVSEAEYRAAQRKVGVQSIGEDNNAGLIAATLPDEDSECRYIATLCAALVETKASTTAHLAAFVITTIGTPQPAPDQSEAAREFEAQSRESAKRNVLLMMKMAANDAITVLRRRLASAAEVVASKHSRAPACLAECSELDAQGHLRRR